MTSFTCITCRVIFVDAELQRTHYKTEWHRYNLKRKVAQLPAVTQEDYVLRAEAQKQKETEPIPTSHCDSCRKSFANEKSYENHLRSKKHKELITRQKSSESHQSRESLASASSAASTASGRVKRKNAKNIAIKEKISEASSSGEGSSSASRSTSTAELSGATAGRSGGKEEDDEYMDVESDDECEDFGEDECMFCSLTSEDFEANIKHMTVDHGFFIPDPEYLIDAKGLFNALAERVFKGHLCLWCDMKSKMFYRRQDVQRHMREKEHCRMKFEGGDLLEFSDFYDYSESDVCYKRNLGKSPEDDDYEVPNLAAIDDGGYSLQLPSGRTAGHRSLKVFFNQRLAPERQITQTHKLLQQYKALGWTGTSGQLAVQRAKDINFARRIRDKHHVQVGIKANKLQHFFRIQNPI